MSLLSKSGEREIEGIARSGTCTPDFISTRPGNGEAGAEDGMGVCWKLRGWTGPGMIRTVSFRSLFFLA